MGVKLKSVGKKLAGAYKKGVNEPWKTAATVASLASGHAALQAGVGTATSGNVLGNANKARTYIADPQKAVEAYLPGYAAGGTGGGDFTAGMVGTNHSDAVSQVAPGSGNSDYAFGGAAANVNANQQKADDAAQAEDARTQQGLLDQLYAKFGVGTSADATANARALDGTKLNILNSYQTQQQNAADTSYLSNLTQQRQQAANTGGIGGSQDQQVRNQLYQAYVGNRAGVLQGRVQADQAFTDSLQQQRQTLENQIKGRQRTNVSGLQADASQLSNAASGAFANATANTLPIAVNLGSNYSLASAYSNSKFNKAFQG